MKLSETADQVQLKRDIVNSVIELKKFHIIEHRKINEKYDRSVQIKGTELEDPTNI